MLGSVTSQDLPAPAPNLQTMPVGSYIIPMDNFYQFNAANLFNIKAYGLIVHLLNNRVKLKWVIKAGKMKDSADVTLSTMQILPTIISTARIRALKAGPFVIFGPDTAGVHALVSAFYQVNGLIGNDRPKMLRSLVSSVVDVRYDMQGFIPKAAILNDGGNELIHATYMTGASMPATNYAISAGRDLITGCYTFASEPHNDRTGAIVDTAIMSIKSFVEYGGNFLAQCDAVINYENSAYGRFQTTTGITKTNVNIGTTVSYINPDLAYSQFEGACSGSAGGSVRNWRINTAGANNEHNHVTGTAANSGVITASVSKLKTGRGGSVFYLGNHDYTTASQVSINGLRLYMNAFLTPSLMPCTFMVLKTDITDLRGELKNNKATLQWVTSENQSIDHFQVEKSIDGKNFSSISGVTASGKRGAQTYSFDEPDELAGPAYYRVQFVSKEGEKKFSKVVTINPGLKNQNGNITLLKNPVTSSLLINYSSAVNEVSELTIYRSNGMKIQSMRINARAGNSHINIPLERIQTPGIYFIEISNSRGRSITRFLKV